jgi:hypothetical protein
MPWLYDAVSLYKKDSYGINMIDSGCAKMAEQMTNNHRFNALLSEGYDYLTHHSIIRGQDGFL